MAPKHPQDSIWHRFCIVFYYICGRMPKVRLLFCWICSEFRLTFVCSVLAFSIPPRHTAFSEVAGLLLEFLDTWVTFVKLCAPTRLRTARRNSARTGPARLGRLTSARAHLAPARLAWPRLAKGGWCYCNPSCGHKVDGACFRI